MSKEYSPNAREEVLDAAEDSWMLLWGFMEMCIFYAESRHRE